MTAVIVIIFYTSAGAKKGGVKVTARCIKLLLLNCRGGGLTAAAANTLNLRMVF
jgi:hypothetical protein